MHTLKIWDDFHKELKKFIYGKTQDIDITDDILQDVFTRIISSISEDQIDTMWDNLRWYIYGITRNTISEYFKGTKIQIPYEEGSHYDEYESNDENSLSAIIAESCLIAFIKNLPDTYKEALLLSEIQWLSQKELAFKLDISYSWAKSRVQRWKLQLKNLLLECCSYESDKYGNLLPGTEKQKNDCIKCS